MTIAKVTQVVAQVLTQNSDPTAKVTQVVAQVLTQNSDPNAVVTQVVAQVLRPNVIVVEADHAIPAEWSSDIARDHAIPVEWAANLLLDQQTPLSWQGGVLIDRLIPVDWLGASVVASDSLIPVDWVNNLNLDDVIHFENLHRINSDIPTELSPDQGFDLPERWAFVGGGVGEVSGSQLIITSGLVIVWPVAKFNPEISIGDVLDWEIDIAEVTLIGALANVYVANSVVHSVTTPGVFSGTHVALGDINPLFIFGNGSTFKVNSFSVKIRHPGAAAPVEWSGEFHSDNKMPVEWLSSILLDSRLPLEWSANVGFDSLIPVDWKAALTVANNLPVEFSGSINKDALIPAEWQGAVLVDSDHAIPISWLLELAHDYGIPVEWSGRLLPADYLMPIGHTLTVHSDNREMIADPGFDNPSGWNYPANIYSSQLHIWFNFLTVVPVPAKAAIIGHRYAYTITVSENEETYGGSFIYFGGEQIWDESVDLGVTTFTGEIVASTTEGLSVVGFFATFRLSYLSVRDTTPAGSPAEWTSSLLGLDEQTPVEWASEVLLDGGIPVEWPANIGVDSLIPVDWLSAQVITIDNLIPVDWKLSLDSLSTLPVEWPVGISADGYIPASWLQSIQTDNLIPVSWLQSLQIDSLIPVEWSAPLSIIIDSLIPVEWLGDLQDDYQMPHEALLNVHSDSRELIPGGEFDTPEQWVYGTATISGGQMHWWNASSGYAYPLPITNAVTGKRYRYRIDIAVNDSFGTANLNFQFGTYNFFGTQSVGVGVHTGEFVAVGNGICLMFPTVGTVQVRLNSVSIEEAVPISSPVEWGGLFSGTSEIPVEYIGSAEADTQLPAEWTSGLSVDSVIPVEWLSLLTLTDVLPVEFSGSIKEDALIPFEWAGAIRVDSDHPIPINWITGLSSDYQTPIEWRLLLDLLSVVPVEFGGAVNQDATIPYSWLMELARYAQAPIEYGEGIGFDSEIPASWIQAIGADSIIPVEWAGAIGVKSYHPIPLDWSGIVESNNPMPTEWLSWIQTLAESGGCTPMGPGFFMFFPVGCASIGGDPIEWGVDVQIDSLIPASWLKWVYSDISKEISQDVSFNDAAKWVYLAPFGDPLPYLSGGQAFITEWTYIELVPPDTVAVVGKTYEYVIDIDSVVGSSTLAGVAFGSATLLWSTDQGAGVFTGEITADDVFHMQLLSLSAGVEFVANSVSIREKRPVSSPVEWSGDISDGYQMRTEWLGHLLNTHQTSVEFGEGAAGSVPMPFSFRGGLFSDQIIPVEWWLDGFAALIPGNMNVWGLGCSRDTTWIARRRCGLNTVVEIPLPPQPVQMLVDPEFTGDGTWAYNPQEDVTFPQDPTWYLHGQLDGTLKAGLISPFNLYTGQIMGAWTKQCEVGKEYRYEIEFITRGTTTLYILVGGEIVYLFQSNGQQDPLIKTGTVIATSTAVNNMFVQGVIVMERFSITEV